MILYGLVTETGDQIMLVIRDYDFFFSFREILDRGLYYLLCIFKRRMLIEFYMDGVPRCDPCPGVCA